MGKRRSLVAIDNDLAAAERCLAKAQIAGTISERIRLVDQARMHVQHAATDLKEWETPAT